MSIPQTFSGGRCAPDISRDPQFIRPTTTIRLELYLAQPAIITGSHRTFLLLEKDAFGIDIEYTYTFTPGGSVGARDTSHPPTSSTPITTSYLETSSPQQLIKPVTMSGVQVLIPAAARGLARYGSSTVGGGGEDPRKSNKGKPGREHEKESSSQRRHRRKGRDPGKRHSVVARSM